jgi:structural maintenance of chromosome 4
VEEYQQSSGGEKTSFISGVGILLSSQASTKHNVMDEIDVLLLISRMLPSLPTTSKDKECSSSFRNNMFELADRLVGIYKTDNCTKSVTINCFGANKMEPATEGPIE